MSELEDQREDEIESGLGELPEDMGRDERIDYLPEYEGLPPPHGSAINARGGEVIPPDIAAENRIRRQTGPLVSPVIPASVTTVYDARPINARDFLHTATDNIALPNGEPELKLRAVANYQVPQGYTGVWRGFSFEPSGYLVYGGLDDDSIFTDVKCTLLVNGIIIPDYENMLLGQDAEFNMPTFVIGNEGQIFTIRIDVTNDYLNNVGDIFYRFTLYGQNLLTRGLPKQFEIATQDKSGRTSPTAR